LKKDKPLFFLLSFFLIVLIQLVPTGWVGGTDWDNTRFILMALFPVLGFTFLLASKKKLDFFYSDISWALFILMGFFSFFWATNKTLIWYQAFGWLTLVLWLILVRVIVKEPSNQNFFFNILLALFLFFFLYLSALTFTGRLEQHEHWNNYFGYDSNRNYTTSFFLSLFPFLLFYDNKSFFFKALKWIVVGFLIFILIKADTRAVMIASFVILLYYLWNNIQRLYFNRLITLGVTGIGFLLLIFLFKTDFFALITGLEEFTARLKGNRLHMLQSSLLMFLDHPVRGVGLANWGVEINSFNTSGNLTFGHPFLFYSYRNHNLYSLILAERGIIGFIALFYPLTKILWKGWFNSIDLTDFQKAAYCTLLVYLVTSLFYHTPTFFEHRFSGMQVLVFFAIGTLSTNGKLMSCLPKTINILFLGLAITCLGWFVYSKQCYDTYQAIESNKSVIGKKETIKQLKTLYHPIFKTNHDYRTSSFALQIANLNLDLKNYKAAESYFIIALKQNPYDRKAIVDYATFLFNDKKAFEKAKLIAEPLHSRQNNYVYINVLLAEIAIEEEDYELADYYIKSTKSRPKGIGDKCRALQKRIREKK